MTPLERITERVNRNGDVNNAATPRPLLTLAEFFEGNEVIGSIGCNLIPTPESAEFYELFKQIALRPEVADVLVQVTMFDNDEWPFSDTVWVITSATPEQVVEWFEEAVRPDQCWQGWTDGFSFEPYQIPKGMYAIACWWD